MSEVASNVMPLPAQLDPGAAQQLLATLQRCVAEGKLVWLDASALETLSLPAIQVLLSAVKHHDTISVVNPSATFLVAMAELGIAWDHQPKPLPPKPPPAEPIASKRVLTIDDSKTMRDMLMLTLSSSGFDVLQASDGEDGIDVLTRESVDVVITDINMPKLDGYGVIRHLRERREFDAVPILVLTTESDREKKERARDLGATGFIVKPFDPSRLADVIRQVSP